MSTTLDRKPRPFYTHGAKQPCEVCDTSTTGFVEIPAYGGWPLCPKCRDTKRDLAKFSQIVGYEIVELLGDVVDAALAEATP